MDFVYASTELCARGRLTYPNLPLQIPSDREVRIVLNGLVGPATLRFYLHSTYCWQVDLT